MILIDKKLKFDKKYENINKYLINTGISLSLFLGQLTNILLKDLDDINEEELKKYLLGLAQLEYDVAKSTFGSIYITSLISIFT